MSERSFRVIDFFSVLLLFIQVSESLKITSIRGKLVQGISIILNPFRVVEMWNVWIKKKKKLRIAKFSLIFPKIHVRIFLYTLISVFLIREQIPS